MVPCALMSLMSTSGGQSIEEMVPRVTARWISCPQALQWNAEEVLSRV
uniref:Uncharacterized protein n=1 Tax=Anguilla anguilla TaxID=7936 RepID=A0A0E9S445_ANGAN